MTENTTTTPAVADALVAAATAPTTPVVVPTALSPEAQAYLDAINAPGVNVLHVAWVSPEKKVAAAFRGHVLTKESTATVMTGVEYQSLSVNNDRETGELPWGEWVPEHYPYLIQHKGSFYARLYTVDGTIRTTYKIDGRIVKREDYLAMLVPSAREPKRPNGGCITVHVEGLTVL
jgi:hypothetical protein